MTTNIQIKSDILDSDILKMVKFAHDHYSDTQGIEAWAIFDSKAELKWNNSGQRCFIILIPKMEGR